MRDYLLRNALIVGIISLFIGTSIIPSSAMVLNKNNPLSLDEQIIVNDGDVIKIISFMKDRSRNIYFDRDDRVHVSNVKNNYYSHGVLNGDDIYFTHPLNNDVLRAGDSINITGTITDEKFKNYIIEYGQGIDPTEWLTTGITLIDGGNSPIEDGTVAIWDTSHITEPDFYTLRITTNLKNRAKSFLLERPKVVLFPLFQRLIHTIFQNNMRLTPLIPLAKQKTNFIKNLYLDPTLKEGWPQRLDWDEYSGGHVWAGLVEPVVSDINNDGDMEIVVYKAGNLPKIYAFNPDGSLVDGWPAVVDDKVLPGGSIGAPSIADIDNDGYQEIFVNGYEGIYIFNHNGSFLRKIIRDGSDRPSDGQECVVYDLDNDGSMEVVKKYKTNRGLHLAVFDVNGTMLSGWPQMYYDYEGPDGKMYVCSEEGMPAIGNFDDDSDLEIVVGANRNVFDDPSNPGGTWHIEGRILVYNVNGSILNGFPLDFNGRFFSQAPAIGDLNNDGDDEIVVAARSIYVIDRYGNNCTGWPQLLDKKFNSASPALADFDNDGYLEIVISKRQDPFKTYIFDYLGNVLSGWPQHTSWNDYRAPIVGDVNGDGIPDVVTTAGNGVVPWSSGDGGVYAWNSDGTLIDGFPKVTEVDAQAAATIADIDNDGKVEIIASSDWDDDLEAQENKDRSTIYVWELDSDFNEATMDWPMFHRDAMHTGYYALDFPILIRNYL